jgi:beta-galactosidase/beta-glucuronidase
MLFPQSNSFRQIFPLPAFWDFRFDPDDIGIDQDWSHGFSNARPIAVPASWNEQFEEGRDDLGPAWYQVTFSTGRVDLKIKPLICVLAPSITWRMFG